MAPQTPDWLNAEFFEKVLKKSEKDASIEVKALTTKPATATGDNYSSDMIRASVKYLRTEQGGSIFSENRKIEETISLIVKISPTVDGFQKDLIQQCQVFDKEITMMSTTLSKMNDLLSKEDHRLGARVFHTQLGDPSVLVLEDLAPLGFKLADRQSGLDLLHCRLTIKGLAKFHATSVALVEKDPKLINTYEKGIFHKDHPEGIPKFFTDALKSLGKEIRNWPELDSSYAAKVEKLSEVGYLKACDCTKKTTGEFFVINHGDCWVNNMLFRYNKEGQVNGHIFVDFQCSVWSSPAIDLLYFLNTSTSEDVYLNHNDALLEEYLRILRDTMLDLGCKTQPPSLAALKKSIKDREFYGVISACTVLPFVLVDKNEAKSINDMMQKDGEYTNPGYKGTIYRKTMIQRLPEWNARGLLDV